MILSIRDRLEAGEFEVAGGTPRRPVEPAILRKAVKDLSDAEIATVPVIRVGYAEQRAAYDEAIVTYNAKSMAAEEHFRRCLEEENGTVGNPKAEMLFNKIRNQTSDKVTIIDRYEDWCDLIL